MSVRTFEDRPDWFLYAKCRYLDEKTRTDFYSEDKNGGVTRAKKICWGWGGEDDFKCPVLRQCALYALANNEKFGVWGGMSERERRRIKRRRRARKRAKVEVTTIKIYRTSPQQRAEKVS